jgi:bifunctional enzyme CysN/CysC
MSEAPAQRVAVLRGGDPPEALLGAIGAKRIVVAIEHLGHARRQILRASLLDPRELILVAPGVERSPAEAERLLAPLRELACALGCAHPATAATVEEALRAPAGPPPPPTPGPRPAPAAADQYELDVIWLAEPRLMAGRRLLLARGEQRLAGSLSAPKHRIDPETLKPLAARTLGPGEVGVAQLTLEHHATLAPFAEDHDRGWVSILEPASGRLLALGLVRFPLRRALNVHWQPLAVDKQARAALKAQRPAVVWFTGLSGAGKSSIANRVEQRLHAAGAHTYLLDGDNLRHGLNHDLGFTEADRIENIRRVAEVARLMVDAGLIVLVSFISPFREQRRIARGLVEPGEFCEVFVDAPLEVAEQRDAKGLYAKARRGELVNFTGIDSPYEPPEEPELRIDTTLHDPEAAAELVMGELERMGVINPAPSASA